MRQQFHRMRLGVKEGFRESFIDGVVLGTEVGREHFKRRIVNTHTEREGEREI